MVKAVEEEAKEVEWGKSPMGGDVNLSQMQIGGVVGCWN